MTGRRLVPAALIALIVGAVGAIGASLIQGPSPDARPTATEVDERTMSPFCPGQTLAECPSAQSVELRERIADRVAAGWTNRRIDGWLVSNYGEAILGRPRGALAWAVPLGGLIAGGVALAVALRRWSRGSRGGPVFEPGTARSDDGSRTTARDVAASRERLAAELRRFGEGTTE